MNLYPYDAVVFDLDGTLFDAEDGITSSALRAMEELGCEVPEGVDLREIIGPPLKQSFRDIFKVPEELIPQGMINYKRAFDEYGIYQYSVYPHIRSLLQMLREGGAHVGLATSKPRSTAVRILEYYGLAHYFDTIAGEDGDALKQHGKPELIRMALPEKYENACMVGDRRFDMQGAVEAGVDGVGVSYGCGSEEELMQAGATHIAPDTESLRALLCPGADVPRGFFLSVEGPDGSGKSTQVELMERKLKQFGFSVLRSREPGGCNISEEIRRIILDTNNTEMSAECEALLYAASRAQHVHQVIRPAVERGELVLCDRFVDSSVAYQGGGRELGVETVQRINELAVADMEPDATLYLAIDHTTALARRLNASEPDRLELEDNEFHERVQKAYERLIRENKKRFMVVDASGDIDGISREAFRLVLSRLDPHINTEA